MYCNSERHRTYHENRICSGHNHGQPGPSSGQAAAEDEDNTGNADDGDVEFDHAFFDDMPEMRDIDSDSSSDDEEFQHKFLQGKVHKSQETFKRYGSDKCTFDICQFVIENSLSKRAGGDLLSILSEHGINYGKGLAAEARSMESLHKLLDDDCGLPFVTDKVSSDLYPDKEYTLFRRSILDCVKHLFAEKDFNGHIHVRPVVQYNDCGQRVFKDLFSGKFVNLIYQQLEQGDILLMLCLYSDKTHLDVLGVHEAYPVYMYLGNVETSVRTKSNHAAIVIGN